MDVADERQAMGLLGLYLDFVSLLPSCLLPKGGGVSLGSLVIHLSENYYIRGLLLIASLSLGHSHSIMAGSSVLRCLGDKV